MKQVHRKICIVIVIDLLLGLFLLLFSGCAMVATKDIFYVRIGSQEIDSCVGWTDPNGVSYFYFTKQKAKIELDPLRIGGLL